MPEDTKTADNGVTLFVDALGRRWRRAWAGDISVRWCGAKGDSTTGLDGTDDTAAIQEAINLIPAGQAALIRLDHGYFRIAGTLTTNGRYPTFLLNGARVTAGKLTMPVQTIAPSGISFDNVAVRIGSNDAGLGRGVLMIGGADRIENGNGTYLANDGHPNWLIAMSSIPFGPTEFSIYGHSTGGVARSNGSNTLVAQDDVVFGKIMIGRTFWFDGWPFRVVDVPSAKTIKLDVTIPAKTATWNFVLTTGSGTCRIVGKDIYRTGGEPYIPFTADPTFVFVVNGKPVSVTWHSADRYIATSPPGDADNAEWFFSIDVNQQITTHRLQKVSGDSEENYAVYARPDVYRHQAQATGFGKLRAVQHCSELEPVVEFAAYGKYVTLGGVSGAEAARFIYSEGAVSRFDFRGGPPAGAAIMSTAGSAADVSAVIGTKGAGNLRVTSHDGGNIEVEIAGEGGSSWLRIGSHNTNPFIQAQGGNSNVRLIGAGSGGVTMLDGQFSTKFAIRTGGIAYFGGNLAAKQTVTGAREGNSALTSLLAALAAYGLITDSSS